MAYFDKPLRTLYTMDYLLKNTDRKHSCSTAELIAAMKDRGFDIGRKSVYKDLEYLGKDNFGLDLLSSKGEHRIQKRLFDLREIRLLTDMVQSSNFIPQSLSIETIKKLEQLLSIHEAKQITRQIHVFRRVKTQNTTVFDNMDLIADSISDDHVISFLYFKFNQKKEKVFQNKGRRTTVSPFALIWADQNYYLLAWSHQAQELRHYRVDRMEDISSSEGPRQGKTAFSEIDMATYPSKVFYAWRGEDTIVHMRFSNSLADAVMDRFGQDLILIPDGEDFFIVHVNVFLSPQFYAWVCGFGPSAEILGPENARLGMKSHLQQTLKNYD